MTLGAWIFLSVVLLLVVLNKPFRKFFLWAAAISAVCCGLFFGYISVRDWRERRAMARQVATEQKKQDDCNARLNARLNAVGAADVFDRLANADLCRANPDITPEEAAPLQAGRPYRSVVEIHGGETLKVVRAANPPKAQTTNGVQFDMTNSIPIVYLGHNQKFALACGVFGEQQVPKEFPTVKNSTASCP